MKLVIVSGLSGSGKTVALHTLEDEEYYCVDNLHLDLLGDFVKLFKETDLECFGNAASTKTVAWSGAKPSNARWGIARTLPLVVFATTNTHLLVRPNAHGE